MKGNGEDRDIDNAGVETPEEAAEVHDSELQEIPEQEIARLRDELEEKAREAGENHDKYLRICADLDNYRKRAAKEKADAISFANEGFIEELLSVIDNMDRALIHATGEHSLDSLRTGVKLTMDQMYALLKKFGLDDVKSVGERFDPAVHHAISEVESEAEPGSVVDEFQKGYYLKGRLLRPAMVSVAKKKE